MRRVVCSAFGPVDDLEVVEEPELADRPDVEVVDVEAAGANFVDALIVQGRYQIRPPLPFTPGMEVAGTLRSTGEPVLAVCWFGGYASQLAVPRSLLHPIPPGLSTGQAAGLVQSYATALFALTRRTVVSPGETVVVLGAGGGVGLATVDVAKALGATVVACASTADKLAAATAAGADATIAYEGATDLKSAIREATGGGADIVVDPVGGAKTDAALRGLGWFGRLVVIGFAAGDIPRLPANQVLLNNRSVIGVDWGAWTGRQADANAALVAELLAMVAEGRLHPVEPTIYPLDEVASCLRDLEGRRLVGKAVLDPRAR